MRLKDKVAIVTGAGRGIGRGTAIRFAEEGAKVVVDDVNPEYGNTTVDQICAEGGTAIFVRADVSSQASAETLVREAIQAYGRVDALVNNAICTT